MIRGGDPNFSPSPGDIVVLNPQIWTPEYAGLLALVLDRNCYQMDEEHSDRLIIVTDPLCPGDMLQCLPEEILAWDASLGDGAL